MEHVTSKDGTRIGFQRSGSGPALLLVHGTTANHKRWAAISPQFERHFTVYSMDRRGRGGSNDSPDYDIRREAEDIAAVIDTSGEPVSVLGHSYGALCSLETALLSERIKRMILYEPPIPTGENTFPPGVPERIQALVDRGELEAALEIFFQEIVNMPEQELQGYRQLPMWKERIPLATTIPRELLIEKTYSFDADKFSSLLTPTLLLLGGDSPIPFRKAAEMVHSTLPNSRLVVLPGQRHVAMDTNPDLFSKEVLGFLL